MRTIWQSTWRRRYLYPSGGPNTEHRRPDQLVTLGGQICVFSTILNEYISAIKLWYCQMGVSPNRSGSKFSFCKLSGGCNLESSKDIEDLSQKLLIFSWFFGEIGEKRPIEPKKKCFYICSFKKLCRLLKFSQKKKMFLFGKLEKIARKVGKETQVN